MADERVERRTLIGFIASAGLLVLVSVVAAMALRGYEEAVRWVSHTHAILGEIQGLEASLSATEAARRGYLATGEPSYLEERQQAADSLRAHLHMAKQLTADNPMQQQRLAALEVAIAQRTSQFDDTIRSVQSAGLEAAQRALAAGTSRELARDTSRWLEELQATERSLLERRTRANEASTRWLIVTLGAMLLSIASVLLWLCLRIRREMALRGQAAASLERANAGLAQANQELESFSYSVSHDLRAPLRAIDGYALMLEEDYGPRLDETARRYIRTIREGSQRMAALIDDLLAFSRLGRHALSHQSVDMTELARRAADEVLETRPRPWPVVEIENLPPTRGDPALLHQVWMNLIGNAVKYSSKSLSPRVRISAQRVADRVSYQVEDNGVGFDMRYADKLFGVFQRLHTNEDYPGTGVGLAIVHRIVARHEGGVSAHGERGKGARFGFTLPGGS